MLPSEHRELHTKDALPVCLWKENPNGLASEMVQQQHLEGFGIGLVQPALPRRYVGAVLGVVDERVKAAVPWRARRASTRRRRQHGRRTRTRPDARHRSRVRRADGARR